MGFYNMFELNSRIIIQKSKDFNLFNPKQKL